MREGIWVYTEQDRGPIPTMVIAFYERYTQERGTCDIPAAEAVGFAMYLLENIDEFEEELAINVAYPPPEPPTPEG